MIIYVDIDDTICTYADGHRDLLDYSLAIPIDKRISAINKLYDLGHTIVYWTARGASSGIDWTDVTKNQLEIWNCRYHKLRMDKPAYDLFIDDKNINSDRYFNS